MPADESIPPIPRPSKKTTSISVSDESSTPALPPSDSKRKAPDEDVDMEADEHAKKARTDGHAQDGAAASVVDPREAAMAFANATAAFIPFLSPDELLPPKMPSREEMEAFLLGLRKKALVEEYFD